MSQPVRASRRKHHIIYKTTCLATGRYYIGMHSTDDLNDGYLGSGVHLTRSVRKHGKDQHVREILEHLPNREALKSREEELVTENLVKYDVMCMNLIKGGNGNDREYGITDKTRELLSIAGKNRKLSDTHKSRIGNAHRGKIMPRAAVEKQRAKMIGYTWSEEQIQKRTDGQLSSDKFKERYRPMIIDGVTYQNGREAVAALKIPGSTLAYRLNSPNWLTYRYADQPEKDPLRASKRARGEYKRST